MDLFNSIAGSAERKTVGIYPSLAILPYEILYNIAPSQIFNPLLSLRDNAFALRSSISGNFILLRHLLFIVIPFTLLFYIQKQGSVSEKILFVISIFLSGPILYVLERGNIIIFALLFILLFISLKDSESIYIREISYIFLAIAACLKLYPAVFGLILIKEKNWKACLHCVIYGLFFFFIPMLFLKVQISDVSVLADNLGSWTEGITVNATGLNLSIKNFVLLVCGFIDLYFFNLSQTFIQNISSFMVILVFCCILFSFFFQNEKWKSSVCLSLLCIFIPNVSWFYTSIFMIIPLIQFLNKDKNEYTRKDILYVVFFGIIFSFLVLPVQIYPLSPYPLTLAFLVSFVLLLLFAVAMFTESVCNCISRKQNILE